LFSFLLAIFSSFSAARPPGRSNRHIGFWHDVRIITPQPTEPSNRFCRLILWQMLPGSQPVFAAAGFAQRILLSHGKTL
jgi:hypothetical protein